MPIAGSLYSRLYSINGNILYVTWKYTSCDGQIRHGDGLTKMILKAISLFNSYISSKKKNSKESITPYCIA